VKARYGRYGGSRTLFRTGHPFFPLVKGTDKRKSVTENLAAGINGIVSSEIRGEKPNVVVTHYSFSVLCSYEVQVSHRKRVRIRK